MIEIKNLYKRFGNILAVNNLNLYIEKGETFGFIGPNGAGKSTTIKILATLLKPSAGYCKIDGIDVCEDPYSIRKILGYMPDLFGLYEELTVFEYLEFFAACYKIPYNERNGIINDILELTDLVFKKDELVGTLSRGMKQRLCLAKTLIHNPKVLILDEPSSGLDPRGRIEMRALLNELHKMGKTIFISSHILSELADFCTSIGIIENGKLVVAGKINDVLNKFNVNRNIKIKVINEFEKCEKILKNFQEVSSIEFNDNEKSFEIAVTATNDEVIANILKTLILNELKVISFYDKGNNLEEVFIKVTHG